jgi:hypothetical protein
MKSYRGISFPFLEAYRHSHPPGFNDCGASKRQAGRGEDAIPGRKEALSGCQSWDAKREKYRKSPVFLWNVPVVLVPAAT